MDHPEQQYLEGLKALLTAPFKGDRTGTGTHALFGNMMRFDLSQGFPLLTTKKLYTRAITHELLWLIAGDTNVRYLQDNDVGIWDEWQFPAGRLKQVYGAQWRRWETGGDMIVEIPRKQTEPEAAFQPSERQLAGKIALGDLEADDLTGSSHMNKEGLEFSVLGRIPGGGGAKNSTYAVKFSETGSVATATRPNVRRGQVKDPYATTVAGVACIGRKTAETEAWQKRAYDMWQAMIARCYNVNHPSHRWYGAKGVNVAPEWKCFETFVPSLSSIPYFERWIDEPGSYSLDKDYHGSSTYGPRTTIFLKKRENVSLESRKALIVSGREGKKTFASHSEAARHLGLDSRRLGEHLAGSRRIEGLPEITERVVPDGMLLRKRMIVDQLANVQDLIRRDPDSRRIIMDSWNVADIGRMALTPCHNFVQFQVSEGKLNCILFQRSADWFLGVPFNIASYAMFTHMMAQSCGLQPGTFTHMFGDWHLYVNHIEQARTQIAREPRPFPKLILNPEIKEITDFRFEDVRIEGYDPHPPIKGEVSV